MNEDHHAALADIRQSGMFSCADLVLLTLANRYGAGSLLSDLVKATGASYSTINMAKNSLEKKGYVVERFPERDRRVTKLYLTEFGKSAAQDRWDIIRILAGLEHVIKNAKPET